MENIKYLVTSVKHRLNNSLNNINNIMRKDFNIKEQNDLSRFF